MSGSIFEYDGRVKQDKGQQFLSGRGHYGDGYTEIRRIQQHGIYSSPPKGSQGLLLTPNGNPDEAYLIGVEHHDHQPTGIPAGGTAIYDASGNILKIVGTGLVIDMQANTISITSGDWTVTAPNITFVAQVSIIGDLHTTGNITAAGTITDSDGNNGA
jgi:phage baseplate assembly protein V